MSHIEDLNKTGDLGKTITHLKAIVAEHEERISRLEEQLARMRVTAMVNQKVPVKPLPRA